MKNGSEVEKAKWKEIQYLFLIENKTNQGITPLPVFMPKY